MLHRKFDEFGQDGETVGDIAFRRIRTDIIHGRLKPGQKLRLEVLKEKYGVSVSTLREILSKLTVEEFVSAEGQRGFEVTQVSQAGLRDVADLRLLLETYALRKSFAEGDLEWEGAVVSAHYKLAQVEKNLIGGDQSQVERWVGQDWGFHHATISACAAPALMTTHSSVFDRFLRYHMLVLDFRGKPAAEEHERLRDLALARDADRAVDVLTAHVQSGVEHILGTGKIPA
ncbi:GntR family transcriptional regulator [Pelagibacterium xiamenense]|uniref:GntR family transcriptional regulator n=1 Tax=Pelagibacterium xiamenense TaxID=2901140 RepID=UPI001E4FAC47|nr:GntR family transcriptional regulator [Pelagibacterium xiamenense]MCD7059577.1 GntR family transcriptional regulator [Pelagibacterium xiamenense]